MSSAVTPTAGRHWAERASAVAVKPAPISSGPLMVTLSTAPLFVAPVLLSVVVGRTILRDNRRARAAAERRTFSVVPQ
jgi:hypothetical protein